MDKSPSGNFSNPLSILSSRKIMAAIIASALTLLILALVFFAKPVPQNQGLKYFELVMEKEDCPQGACFIEYIFASNGMLMKKQYDLPNYQGTPSVELRFAEPSNISNLFGDVERFSSGNSRLQNPSAEHNHFFYYNGNNLSAFTMPDPPDEKFAAIFQDAENIFANARNGDDFFIHLYYMPTTGDTKDLHIFSDGTVIKSIFSNLNNTMLSTSFLQASELDMKKIRELAAKASGSSPDATECASTDIIYGVAELKFNKAYASVNTCGSGKDSYSALFNYIHDKGFASKFS